MKEPEVRKLARIEAWGTWRVVCAWASALFIAGMILWGMYLVGYSSGADHQKIVCDARRAKDQQEASERYETLYAAYLKVTNQQDFPKAGTWISGCWSIRPDANGVRIYSPCTR